MNRRGFTIVELIIVIAVMGILLTLAVVNLRSSQVNARDDERKTDIANIAVQLESFYTSGTDGSTSLGRYPSTYLIGHEQTLLRDVDQKSLDTPGTSTSSLVVATNNTQTTAGIAPQPTISQYVYQSLQSNGSLCTSEAQECKEFNLFYRLEADNLVYMINSKNQ